MDKKKELHELMINNRKGKYIFNNVSPIYDKDPYNLGIFNAIGEPLTNVDDFVNSLSIEFNKEKASWTLHLLEELHGIIPDPTIPKTQRIARLIFEMNKYRTMTPKTLQDIINAFVADKNATVEEIKNSYRFTIDIPNNTERDSASIINAVEEVKPAHLDYNLSYTDRFNVYVGQAIATFEDIRTEPLYVKESYNSMKINQGSVVHTIETTTLYPKGDI